MNFSSEIDKIIRRKNTIGDKIKDLANVIVTKVMHVAYKDVVAAEAKVNALVEGQEYDEEARVELIIIQSVLLTRGARYNAAIEMIDRLDEETTSIKESLRACLLAIKGVCYRSLGYIENAFSTFHKAIEIFNASPNEGYEHYLYLISYYQIGELNAEIKDFDSMLALHLKSYEMGLELGYPVMINRSVNGIAKAYYNLKDFENALKYFQIGEQYIAKLEQVTPIRSKNWHDIGLVYYQQQQYESALDYLYKSLADRQQLGLLDAISSTQIDIARVHLAQSNPQDAITILKETEIACESLNVSKKLVSIYEMLAVAYEQQQQTQLALTYYKRHHVLYKQLNDILATQVENEQVRMSNTKLSEQKKLISQQKKAISDYAVKLEEANELLQNFAYLAAHDLKAPIRISKSFVQLLEMKHKEHWDEEDREYLGYVTNNMTNLSKMIDNLLSLSKLNSNLPDTKSIDITKLIGSITTNLQDEIKEINADIVSPTTIPKVIGHDTLIEQLFQNLISNALKYHDRKSPPKIEISYTIPTSSSKEKKYIQFAISDNGPGMDADFQKTIFDLFTGSRRKDSYGIGLATCKKIISNYNGKIWVTSTLGQGTSIFFTLLLKNTAC